MAPVSSVTDPDSNHWVRATSRTQGSQADAEIWYAAAAGGLSTTQAVTVTVGGTSAVTSAIAFTVLDVSGAASVSPLDVIAANGGSTQPASTNFTATTTQASEIAIADIGWNTGTNLSVSGQTAGYSSLPTQTSTVKNTNAGEQGAWEALTATGATRLFGDAELIDGGMDRRHRHLQVGSLAASDHGLQPVQWGRGHPGHDHRQRVHWRLGGEIQWDDGDVFGDRRSAHQHVGAGRSQHRHHHRDCPGWDWDVDDLIHRQPRAHANDHEFEHVQ